MSNYKHLNANVLPLLELSDIERANYMLCDRFITHKRLAPIMEHIEFLRYCPPKTRAKGLVVFGANGAGKTMVAEAIERRYPGVPAEDGAAPSKPVINISMTGAHEARGLYDRVLRRLGVPDPDAYSGRDRERMVITLCTAAGVRMLVADEMQDILESTPRQQQIALATIKYLMNELRLSIIVLGIASTPQAMKLNPHLNSRFVYRELPVWKQDEFLVDFLNTLEHALPLRKASHLTTLPITSVLMRLSEGVLGQIVELVCHAAAYAVESGAEQITPELLEKAATMPPAAAVRKAAEEARKSGEEKRKAA